jgi:hypothetical protein
MTRKFGRSRGLRHNDEQKNQSMSACSFRDSYEDFVKPEPG